MRKGLKLLFNQTQSVPEPVETLRRGVYRTYISIPQSPASWREQSSILRCFSPVLFYEYIYLHVFL